MMGVLASPGNRPPRWVIMVNTVYHTPYGSESLAGIFPKEHAKERRGSRRIFRLPLKCQLFKLHQSAGDTFQVGAVPLFQVREPLATLPSPIAEIGGTSRFVRQTTLTRTKSERLITRPA